MQLDELKQQKIWLLWNYTEKGGNMTKVPVSAKGKETGTDEPHRLTWVTYAEAVKAMEKLGASGVGFVVPDNMFFLDIDRADQNDLAGLMLERFGSYAEKSPSGNGFHILGLCDPERMPFTLQKGSLKLDPTFYQKNSKLGLELYFGKITNRFATFTGQAVNDSDLADCSQACLVTLDKNMRRPGKKKARVSGFDDDIEGRIFDIVSSLRNQKNSEKFIDLYDRGDWMKYYPDDKPGKDSNNEADLALCEMIAYRAGDDPEIIDQIFRKSALYRKKWDREDYRSWTISKAIEYCDGQFHPSAMEHPDFVKFDKNGKPSISAPLLAKHCREHLNYILVRDSGKQALLKYVYEGGFYHYYSDNMMMGRIKSYIAEYNEELVSMGKVSETLQHINTDLNYVSQDSLNDDEAIINFKNTLLRVSKSDLITEEHSPDIYSTIQIPCEWTGKDSPTPVFDYYLDTLADGNEDVKQLLLEYIGACLSNIKGYRMKKALFLVGDGDTGKSQLKGLVERLLGRGNFIGIDLAEIEARFGTGAMYGVRLAGSSDMSFLSIGELKTFKKLTGGDSIFAEFKGQQAFEYTYSGLLWFCMNRLPKFGGDDGRWVYDRIMIVECKNVIARELQDTQLLDKMYEERNGIVYKSIKALQKVIARGYRFTEPECVTEARARYQLENNTVISFFEDCMCERDSEKIEDFCTVGRIFKVYKAWCEDNNNGYAKTLKEFKEKIADHLGSSVAGITAKRNNGLFFKKYTLSKEVKLEYSRAYGIDFD